MRFTGWISRYIQPKKSFKGKPTNDREWLELTEESSDLVIPQLPNTILSSFHKRKESDNEKYVQIGHVVRGWKEYKNGKLGIKVECECTNALFKHWIKKGYFDNLSLSHNSATNKVLEVAVTIKGARDGTLIDAYVDDETGEKAEFNDNDSSDYNPGNIRQSNNPLVEVLFPEQVQASMSNLPPSSTSVPVNPPTSQTSPPSDAEIKQEAPAATPAKEAKPFDPFALLQGGIMNKEERRKMTELLELTAANRQADIEKLAALEEEKKKLEEENNRLKTETTDNSEVVKSAMEGMFEAALSSQNVDPSVIERCKIQFGGIKGLDKMFGRDAPTIVAASYGFLNDFRSREQAHVSEQSEEEEREMERRQHLNSFLGSNRGNYSTTVSASINSRKRGATQISGGGVPDDRLGWQKKQSFHDPPAGAISLDGVSVGSGNVRIPPDRAAVSKNLL